MIDVRIRQTLARLTAVAVCSTAIAATAASPAMATDTYFYEEYVHLSSGASAIQASGNINWLNRSVTFSGITMWLRAGECGRIAFTAYQYDDADSDFLDVTTSRWCNSTTSGKYVYPGDVTLDGSSIVGGIPVVTILVADETHGEVWQEQTCQTACRYYRH
ncbi:hypothetical protein GSF22_00450 [Micromonospora echinofusca]|uniref:Secreted protein n=2 Tax=Micromonospora echinofusca TaxID=47858 RepID=A0ABS3VIX9_MICEH|nr:hypothetical protein [Micromonospora echinofusca]